MAGEVVEGVCPAPRFRSGEELVEVQYFLIAVTHDVEPAERRAQRWVPLTEVDDTLTHDEARQVFAAARPLIRRGWASTARSTDVISDELQSLLLAEYGHVADSLLRNEEDGERRVRFFLSLAGAAAGVVALVRGDTPNAIRPDQVDSLVAAVVAVIAGIGTPDAEGIKFLTFDPYDVECRPRPSWRSIGKGGWLETVALYDALLVGVLLALLTPTAHWAWDDVVLAVQ